MAAINPRIVFCTLGTFAALVANYIISVTLVLPNAYKYNTGDSNFLVELFYSFSSASGYEPFPNLLNLMATVAIGIAGGLFCFRLSRK